MSEELYTPYQVLDYINSLEEENAKLREALEVSDEYIRICKDIIAHCGKEIHGDPEYFIAKHLDIINDKYREKRDYGT